MAIVLLDLIVLVHLGGGLLAASLFVAFLSFFLLPAVVIAARAPLLRTMPPELRLTSAGVIVVLLAVPWFFARKALGGMLLVDLTSSLVLTLSAMQFASPRALLDELRPALRPLVIPVLVVLPVIFALVWLGFEVRSGEVVRYYGLFAIDFGNLTSVISSLRASPMLPLSFVSGAGGLAYHWLYFVLPAMFADFLGARISSANALILTNLLIAALLVHTVTAVAGWFHPRVTPRHVAWTVALVLFAPFTVYFYQTAAARFPIGWFAMPTRNHLLLSPVASMISFGNNTFALVLALVTIVELERWNRDGRVADALFGVIALAAVIGYSVTLVFSLAGALLVWVLLGRVRRPLLALTLAALIGAAAGALFLAIGLLTTGGSRHVAVAFDNGQFFRMVLFGIAPLWVIVLLGGGWRTPLNIAHIVIAAAVAVPTMLYTSGSGGGSLIDFSMKTASLVAVAFAVLLPPAIEQLRSGGVARWRSWVAPLLIALGVTQTAAFVLQFPWYLITRANGHCESIPADYHDGLIWLRDHAAPRAIVVDPQGLNTREVLYTLIVSERRAWLPTVYTDQVLIAGSHVDERRDVWRAFTAGDPAASRQIAAEADYLIVPGAVRSTDWRLVRSGTWNVFESAIRKPRG
ncbi:MAG TPA: hypothetical protein VNN08_21890 [Thermoanaerobaculia bacterium]|nr:hypothetical protein [Thermoanaerobaculia bacterium]